jgi:signal transduction histidine kinase
MDGADLERRISLLRSVLGTMVALAFLGFAVSLFDSRNSPVVSVLFYTPIVLAIYSLRRHVRPANVTAAAWTAVLFFWAIISFAVLVFGGLQGGNAATFGVCVIMAGELVGGGAAVALAVASSAWCAFIALLELRGLLPTPLGPYSPLNAWAAVTITLALTSVLVRNSLRSMEKAHADVVASAAQRDEALRRSIQAQKMEVVGNLASGVAHDFNNLLSIICSVSDALKEELGSTAAGASELLQELDEAASRAVLLTRQLTSFGRNKPVELTRVDLGELVRAFAPMAPRLLGSTVTVHTETITNAFVMASRAGVEQLLLNLTVNAREAMPRGGRFSVVMRATDDRVELVVSDTGIGMDAATLARVFDPFFTTKTAGTGLGLATVRDIVARSQGTVTATSEVGRGTSFCVSLPMLPAAAAPRAATLPTVAVVGVAGLRRLLLAEDDPLVRRATVRVLEQAGLDVVAVSNGAEALALLSGPHDFACLVSDIAMPELDGEALATRLGQLGVDIPIVLMSGNRVPSPGLLGPRCTFIEKPVDRGALLAAIARVAQPS